MNYSDNKGESAMQTLVTLRYNTFWSQMLSILHPPVLRESVPRFPIKMNLTGYKFSTSDFIK